MSAIIKKIFVLTGCPEYLQEVAKEHLEISLNQKSENTENLYLLNALKNQCRSALRKHVVL